MPEVDQNIGRSVAGKYELLAKLGQGGMGVVYQARHEFMDRTVAIKLLKTNSIDQDDEKTEFLARFEREAQTASKIRHPSAITIFDYGPNAFDDDSKMPYLVMEYIQGRTLNDIMEAEELTEERLLPIIQQVCAALEEAHGLGIVHRDLKPDNIMISDSPDGGDWAHVLDFGIAKLVEQADEGLTCTGLTVGTPKYMSPEQTLGRQLDGRADIYALGLILYECLSGGKEPFEYSSVMDLVVKRLNQEPIPIDESNPTISKELAYVVMKAIEVSPDNRQQSVAELAEQVVSASSGKLDISRIPRKASGRGGIYAGIGTIALVAVVGIFAFQGQPESVPAKEVSVLSEKLQRIQEEVKAKEKLLAQEEAQKAAMNKRALELELQVDSQELEEQQLEQIKQEALAAKAREAAAIEKERELKLRLEQMQREQALAKKRIEQEQRLTKRRMDEQRTRELENRRTEQARVAPPPPPPKRTAPLSKNIKEAPVKKEPNKSKKRRRCGPNWC